MALITDKTLRDQTNTTATTTNGYGKWSVFAAVTLKEALYLSSFIKNGSIRRMVLATHGGYYKSKKDGHFRNVHNNGRH